MASMRFLGSSRLLAGFVSLLLLCAVLPRPALADTINFDAEPNGVLTQHPASHTTFRNATVRDYGPGFAHSGTKGIEACFAQEFCTAPLRIDFSAGQQRVKLWVGFSAQLSAGTTVVLRAHEQYDSQVGNAQVILNSSAGPIPVRASLEIVAASPNIRYVTVFLREPNGPSVNNGLVVDDVEFDTAGTQAPCTAPLPTVALSHPTNGTVVHSKFRLQGTVTTASPLLTATLGAKPKGSPGEGTVENILGTVVSTSGGPFATDYGGAAFVPGENTVIFTVRNCRGFVRVLRNVTYKPSTSATGFKYLGLEVVQATQDLEASVPLVANKPTIVRVYLAADGTPSITGAMPAIENVTGDLTVIRPGSFGNITQALHSVGAATIDASPLQDKRSNANASLNFVVPDELVRAGKVNFKLSKLYIHDLVSTLPCVGCEAPTPLWQFRLTKPLRLVLAPYFNAQTSQTPDILFAPMLTLQFVNNVFPISGDFPSDDSGIKLLRILPMGSTGRNLASTGQAQAFVNELADVASDVLDQYGSDVRLFGMVPCLQCGGMAVLSGRLAFGKTWAIEDGVVPVENIPDYGKIWAQELGHNFGRNHVSNDHNEASGGGADLNSPYAHGSIGEPGVAISTLQWLGSPYVISPSQPNDQHAHDFMSYGGSPHWVSPYTYKALFSKFSLVPPVFALAPQASVEKLVVGGSITTDGRTNLRPFHRIMTRTSTSGGNSGTFSVELIDAAGRVTLTHRFDAEEIEDSQDRSFTEFVPWRAGTQKIVVKRGGAVLATQAVSRNAPRLQITSPAGGDAWGAKAVARWQASDDDGDRLTFAVSYNTGRDQTWIPIANGLTANEVTIDTSLLPGSNTARIRVRATDGVNTTIVESRPFNVADKPPLIAIFNPKGEKPVARGAPVDLTGFAYDPEDGMLTGDRLTWVSDRDRGIARGGRLKTRLRSLGRHVITLTATDSRGRSVSARTFVRVER